MSVGRDDESGAAATVRWRATTTDDVVDDSTSFVREFVADAVDCDDVARIARIAFELAANILDVRVDGAIERLGTRAAHDVKQLLACEDASRRARHRVHDLKFGRRQLDRWSIAH